MTQPESTSSTCPVCGAPLDPESRGGCPHCLMLAAMKATEGSVEGTPQLAPAIGEVAAAFPQLEIIELIGQGGMGCVFKARQPRLNRLVALKLLPASLAQRDPAFAGRFEREGQLLARLHHPNIVAVHDSGTAGEFFYLTMEYVDGVNLRQAMRSRRFAPREALAIVPLICDALQFAHDEGVLHRDIKPENILLDGKGRVKLADFGIAKLVAEADLASSGAAPAGSGLTHSGAALGTPSYMAPEQRETPQDVDHRADIYSLGVVFYELLTGELPRERFTPPSARCEADPRIDPIVRQALEKDRDLRQRSAGEVRTQVTSLGGSGQAVVWNAARKRLALALLFLVLGIAAPLAVMNRLDLEVQRNSAERLASIREQQGRVMTLNTQFANAQANATRAGGRAGNGALPEEFRRQAREEEEEFQRRMNNVNMELEIADARLSDLRSTPPHSNRNSWLLILASTAPFLIAGLVLLVRNGNGRIAAFAGGVLLLLIFGFLALRVTHRQSPARAVAARQQSIPASAPKYSGISENDRASAYFAHDDVEVHYVLFHAGRMRSSNRGGRNRQSLTWNDESAITLANGRSFGVTRDSANETFVTINGHEYDLRRGRLFVLNDDGTVIQRNVHPSLKEARSLKTLQALAAEESARTGPGQPGVEADTAANAAVESWSYTPRYLTRETIEQRRQSPNAADDEWSHDVTLEQKDGVMTVAGPRERVRRAATLLRILDYPEPKSIADLRGLNDGPDVFTSMALPVLMKRSDFAKAPLTDELIQTLNQSGITASQLGSALSAHVLELEKAEFVNRGVPFEQITRSPGASTYYEGTIPCADRPGQPLTLRIERTTQQMGTQSKFDRFAPWLLEEAKNLPAEPK